MAFRHKCLIFYALIFVGACCGPGLTAGLNEASQVRTNADNIKINEKLTGLVSPTTECIACTGLVGLYDQWHIYHGKSCDSDTMYEFCGMLPIAFSLACNEVVRIFGQNVTDLLNVGETVDVICTAMTFCNISVTTGSPLCHLFPLPESNNTLSPRLQQYRIAMQQYINWLNYSSSHDSAHRAATNTQQQLNFDVCDIPLVSLVCKYIQKIFTRHSPVVDVDDDEFSTVETLRGYDWRGHDCNDIAPYIRPGREPVAGDFFIDSNCNGISGFDFWSARQTYEQKFCANSSSRGIAMLGDSATAHFHIPWEYLNATAISEDILRNLTFVLENEFDWPQYSFSTGWEQSTWPVVQGPTDSLYLRLRERNLCNHRDYQNIGVNGADSFDALESATTLARDPASDKPLIVFYGYIGNDVCNHWIDTLDHDTHARRFAENLNITLKYLNTRLPPNSYVIVMDLVDARFLYDNMHNRTHPLGALRQDVTMENFYDYLNCLDTSPCRGWLTSNETLRTKTLHRVKRLNRAIAQTVVENQGLYENYKLYHMPDPIGDVFKIWVAAGGELWQLIEPTDGFHPNQYCNSVIAAVLWNRLLQIDADIVGPVNPFNDQIRIMFGDQGGY